LLAWAPPATAQQNQTIVFEVLLPGGATLEIEGYKTTSTGERRTFETPAVPVGKTYSYALKANDGQTQIAKTILLRPEGSLTFDLRPDFVAARRMPKAGGEQPRPGLAKGPEKAGFVTFIEDGRLWVFRQGSKELADFRKDGELAKHVIRPGAGPNGMTVKAPDTETVLAYTLARDGFVTVLEKGGERLWVFKTGSKELADFKRDGELAKHVVRIKAGPMGMTIKAPDAETIDAYMKGFSN
jgi:uncharacterized protein (TIGR03000 family)